MTTQLLRPVTSSRALDLDPFQTDAIESLREAPRSGNRRILLKAPKHDSGKRSWPRHQETRWPMVRKRMSTLVGEGKMPYGTGH